MLRQRAVSPQTVATIKHVRNGRSVRADKKITPSQSHKRGVRLILLALSTIVLLLFKAVRRFGRTPRLGEDVLNIPPIEMLSTVPLGFTLNLPGDLGALEVYLDSRLVSSIDTSELAAQQQSSQKERQAKDTVIFNFGTCDIANHGENIRKHAFSIEDGTLGDLKSVFLKPGKHLIEILRRGENHQLIPYAQLTVKVDSPPEFMINSFESSPYGDAYNLALKETGNNIACNHFVAGTGWSQLWTRDTSFAAELGAALIHPEVVKRSLMSSVELWKNGKHVWLQDRCGHFGGWPNLSDAIVGARGAWSLYLVNGDKEFLSWAYNVTKSSLMRAEVEVFDSDSGLFLGCSSFLESNSGYPELYMNDGALVGKTKALSTNMLYYAGYKLASKMGRELEASEDASRAFNEKADSLRSNIRDRLWSKPQSNYAYFEDENGMLVDNTEGLGISLALIDFSDDERNGEILRNTHTTKYGIACLWPQFKYSPSFHEERIPRHYHNGRLWPFVQGYWARAAAEHQQMDLFTESLKGLTALSQVGATFAEYYELNATYEEERRSQLWSAAGYLSMIYHGVFGIRLAQDGIRFQPMKPIAIFDSAKTIHLMNVRYRAMKLNIHLSGAGQAVESFQLNRVKQSDAFIKSDKTGVFDVDVKLK